jgi:hypothetical protein
MTVDFGVFSFSYSTKSNLSSMDASEYSQLVHSRLEMATKLRGARISDAKAEIVQDSENVSGRFKACLTIHIFLETDRH